MERLLNKELKRKIILFLIPFFGYWLIRILFLTCKKVYNLQTTSEVKSQKEENETKTQEVTKQYKIKEQVIVAFWHGELLMQPFLYKKIKQDPKIAVMISHHFDGEIISRLINYFGFKSIRGSSSKGAIGALKETFSMVNNGFDIGITPDGPRGPRHSMANGIVSIAKKKGLKIVALNFRASKFWRLKSWDQFLIPKPFSTIYFYASEPFDVSLLEDEAALEYIKNKMLENAA